MSKTDIQNWLLENAGFLIKYNRLLIDSVSNQFLNLQRISQVHEPHDWKYLLLCASLLAQSKAGKCQDAALRIAQYCMECNEASEVNKHGAAVILDTLANRPAITLAEKRKLLQPDYVHRLPFPLFQDWTKRSIENSITLSNNNILPANKFQCAFWNSTDTHDWISLSAPTSAGKSFIVGHWLSDYLRVNNLATIIYIVPTRALIQQVQIDIESTLRAKNIEHVSVAALPLRSSLKDGEANVFVFTQERLHVLLAAFDNNIKIDLMIVDEAQKVGDNYRGILLQQAIEAVICQNQKCKVVFASPMTDNPEVLLEDAPANISRAAIISEDTMVNQNLIWISQERGQSKNWSVELILNKEPIQIGNVQLPSSPAPESKRLPFVAFAIGNPKGGNVIYVNGAADAEKTAKQLYDLAGSNSDLSEDKEICELISLIQKIIHPQYCLSEVLRRGIAFHYGNMPLLVRTEVERLFGINKIKYLVCTSTLIEGVNMPCQSMFVRGPQKGRAKPMSQSDFWNLAGRAGRWGKEFQGNIVCVDARQNHIWDGGAPRGRIKYHIYRTADEVLLQEEQLLFFIENGTLQDGISKNYNFEYVFSYLVSSHLRNGNITSTTWAKRFSPTMIKTIGDKIANVVSGLSIPADVILRNPGISPIAMNNLLKYFDDRTVNRKESIEELIPVSAESEDAFKEYVQILHRINSHFGNVFGSGARVGQLALLIVDWMKGYPLARIISSRESFYRKNGRDFKLPNLIRDTMKDVEEFARFQAPKYLSCYVDILRVYLNKINRSDLVRRLKEMNVLLEFGVSQETQLALIGLGLSRSSAITISEFIADDSFDESKCLQWLSENDWITKDMPEIVKREITNVLSAKT